METPKLSPLKMAYGIYGFMRAPAVLASKVLGGFWGQKFQHQSIPTMVPEHVPTESLQLQITGVT